MSKSLERGAKEGIHHERGQPESRGSQEQELLVATGRSFEGACSAAMVGRKFSSFLGAPDRASGKLILNGGVDSTKLMNVTVTPWWVSLGKSSAEVGTDQYIAPEAYAAQLICFVAWGSEVSGFSCRV